MDERDPDDRPRSARPIGRIAVFAFLAIMVLWWFSSFFGDVF